MLSILLVLTKVLTAADAGLAAFLAVMGQRKSPPTPARPLRLPR